MTLILYNASRWLQFYTYLEMETNNSVKEREPACFKTNRQKIENEFSVTTLIYAYSNIIIKKNSSGK